MNVEWIVRGAFGLVGYALGARGKDAARQKAAWEGLEVGVQLGSEASKQAMEQKIKEHSDKNRRW